MSRSSVSSWTSTAPVFKGFQAIRAFSWGLYTITLLLLIVLPLPAYLLDAAVALNFLCAFLALFGALHALTFVDLSTFPTLLLVSTVFRLATSVATCRAVLSGGNPGAIVRQFGETVAGGSLAVGITLFLIVSVVQFVVVTKGAERIAEVSARFMLDALPGRQMSIEADVRASRIDQAEAGRQRDRLREESQVMGALEGAMRFVKGDSIATVVITVLNLVGGLSIALLVRGEPLGQAVSHYLRVSIGDGLAAQLPSTLSAVAAAILVSRAGSSRSDIGARIAAELAASERSVIAAALALAGLAFLPGFPAAIMLPIAAMIAAKPAAKFFVPGMGSQGKPERPEPEQPLSGSIFVAEAHHADQFICRLNSHSYGQLKRAGFGNLMVKRRPDTVMRLGIRLPRVSFSIDDNIETGILSLCFEGIERMRIDLRQPTRMEDVASTFEAFVIEDHVRTFAADDVEDWLKECEPRYGSLVASVRQIDSAILLQTTRRLLMERVSIAHPRPILAAMAARAAEAGVTNSSLVADARLSVCDRLLPPSGSVRSAPQDLTARFEQLAQSHEAMTVAELVKREKFLAETESHLRSFARETEASAIIVPDHLRYVAASTLLDSGMMIRVISETEFAAIKHKPEGSSA